MTFYYRYDNRKKKRVSYADDFFADASATIKTTKVFDIESVIDPKTNEEISAKEAVEKGIINEATGLLMHSPRLSLCLYQYFTAFRFTFPLQAEGY